MSAKAKGVRHCHFESKWSGLVRHIIQIALGIGILVVDRRRHDLVAQRQEQVVKMIQSWDPKLVATITAEAGLAELEASVHSLIVILNNKLEEVLGEQRDVARALAQDTPLRTLAEAMQGADVFIQGFRPGVIDRLGFGYGQVSEREACPWRGPRSPTP